MTDKEEYLLEAILELTQAVKELRQELQSKDKSEKDIQRDVLNRYLSLIPPDMRIVKQKPIEQPKTGTEEIINWTTQQVNNHLSDLAGDDLKAIVNSALTGKPIVEKNHQHHPNSTHGEMTNWLNQNIPVVNTQSNIEDVIAQAQRIANERWAKHAIEAKEVWQAMTNYEMADSPAMARALALADVDTAKTDAEIEQALRMPDA
jgi:hypothetical protein